MTKIYSDEEPELIDGDVFKTVVPLGLSLMGMSDNGKMSDNLSDNSSMSDKISEKSGMGNMPHKEKLIAGWDECIAELADVGNYIMHE